MILLTGCAVFFAVLAVTQGPEGVTHEAIMTALSDLDVDHASLQRDVLQARSGLLRNYDPLVDAVVRTRATVDRVRVLLSGAGITHQPIDDYLSSSSTSMERDEALVEEFKTRNALLQNSIGIFNETLTRLYDSPHQETQRALASSNDLGNMMMRFAAEPRPSLAQEIRTQLRAMLLSEAAAVPEIRTLVTHGSMVLATLPAVDESVSQIQSSSVSQHIRTVRQEYLENYGRLSTRAYWIRVFLGSASAVLCLSVSLLVYRLRSRTERLSRRLAFETVLGNAKDRMAEFGTDDFREAITAAADRLAQFFNAQFWRLAAIHVESGDFLLDYTGTSGSPSHIGNFLHDIVKEMKVGGRECGGRARFFYRNLRREEDLAYTRDALSSGVVVATEMNEGSALLFLLEYDEARPKASDEEISLFHAALEAFAHEFHLHRSRQETLALEHRLEHAQRLEAIGTLAGGIAHEFNNILGAIMGYGEMALQSLRRPSQTTHYLDEILLAGDRARQVIDQILTFSRKRDRISKPFDAGAALVEMLPLVRASIPEDFALEVELPETPLVIVGHPVDLQQVVLNLCRNASEASGQSGRSEIALRSVEIPSHRVLSHGEVRPGPYALLVVTDYGSGIAEGILPHIFEPFFTTKSEKGGTGLGLATVHGSATELGGQIDVRSEPGRGTCFELFFPLSNASATPLTQFLSVREVPFGDGETVLVLEKDAAARLMYEEKLAALGYEPVGFCRLDDIISWLDTEGMADCLLLDLASLDSKLSPSDLQRVLRDLPYVPVIDPGREDFVSSRRFRQDGALARPVDSRSLASAIHQKIVARSASQS